ncbi:MAG: hypothetical protein H6621_04705 [Halobacteriovoraceae bacterium]|nr:hypothetical protein [Halobacteriovoraceae bacterium]
MQTFINTFLLNRGKLEKHRIFGYSSKGLPGVEVIGFGRGGRLMKEKLIYLSKSNGLLLAQNKYVLCLENADERTIASQDYFWFELPLLILFWSLAEVLPLKSLDECLCAGKVDTLGKIVFEKIPENLVGDFRLISDLDYQNVKVIKSRELFQSLKSSRKIRLQAS